MIKKYIFILTISFLFTQCHTTSFEGNPEPPSHQIWDKLLKKHVSIDGLVQYKGFIEDSLELNKYLKLLSENPPNEKSWTVTQQKAYWVNAYNAFTIKLILKHYPLKSIKDIGSTIQIPFVNTPWDIEFISIGDQKMDLNDIEHQQLRKRFNDPRIHFAIVCASKSCPALLNDAYTAKQLNQQLNSRAIEFLSDNSRNKIAVEQVQLSKIFDWYESDFTSNGTIIDFLNKSSPVKINKSAKISHMEYDWNLNE